jgi:hypothetical protein
MRSGAVLPPSELLRKPGGFEPFRLVEVGASGCDLAVTDLDHVPCGPLYPHAAHPTHRDEMHLDQNSIVNRVGRAGGCGDRLPGLLLNLQEVGDALMAAIDGPLHDSAPEQGRSPLDVGPHQFEHGLHVSSVEGLVDAADDLDVLLRHLPGSMSSGLLPGIRASSALMPRAARTRTR